MLHALLFTDLEFSTSSSVCQLNTFRCLDKIWTKIRILDKILDEILIMDGQKNDILDAIFVVSHKQVPPKRR